eukprot:5074096-Prymnesium_polylepis.2
MLPCGRGFDHGWHTDILRAGEPEGERTHCEQEIERETVALRAVMLRASDLISALTVLPGEP